MWIIPLALLIFVEALADVLAKEWSLRRGWVLWLGAIAAYVLANTFWLFALKAGSGLARGGIIFSVASAILAAGLGLVLYHEDVSKAQFLGIALGVISIVLIFWPAGK